MMLYVLQESNKDDRVFTSLDMAKQEAAKIIKNDSQEYTEYPPDSKYYFYAKGHKTMKRIKIKLTRVEGS